MCTSLLKYPMFEFCQAHLIHNHVIGDYDVEYLSYQLSFRLALSRSSPTAAIFRKKNCNTTWQIYTNPQSRMLRLSMFRRFVNLIVLTDIFSKHWIHTQQFYQCRNIKQNRRDLQQPPCRRRSSLALCPPVFSGLPGCMLDSFIHANRRLKCVKIQYI